jgi:hypothetical protein
MARRVDEDDEDGPSDGGLCRAVGLAASAILAAIALPMLQGRIYVEDDLQKFHLPLRAFYADCLARGDRFEWCPDLFCGFDLHGEGQVGMYHPLHLALYGLLPLTSAFNLELLANYVVAFAGMALFLRHWRLPRSSALFGALAYSGSGFFTLRYMFLNFLAIAAHIPWLLLAIDVVLRGEAASRRAWAALALAFLTASQLLLGYPQSFWESLLAEAIYALWLASRAGRGCWRRLAPLLGAKALGVLLGGIQLIPTWEALSHSSRAEPTPEFLAHGSLHPANLIQLVSPYLFKYGFFSRQPPATIGAHELGMYAGAAVPVLLAWLLIRRRWLGPLGPLALAASLIGAIALTLAFGSHNPLFAFYTRLPILSKFRISARYVLLVHLATALLAAIALADLRDWAQRSGTDRMGWRRLWPLAIPMGISLVVGVGAELLARAWPGFALSPFLATMDRALAGVALVATATVFAMAAARGWRPALAGLVLFAAVDQALYGLSFLRRNPPMDLASLLRTRALPPVAPGERIMVPEGDDLWIMKGVKLVEGYAALRPRRRLHYYDRASLRLAGARWLLEGGPEGRRVWVPLADPLPRARLVTRAKKRMLVGGSVRPSELSDTAFVPEALDLPAGGTPGTATLVVDRPGRIDIDTDAPSRQFLILAESYHEGWRVRVDGRDARAIRVDGDFLGCVVESGMHRVSFRYRSPGFLLGMSLSGLGLLLATGIAVTLLVAGRSRDSAAGPPRASG